jgi:hypothetical protein
MSAPPSPKRARLDGCSDVSAALPLNAKAALLAAAAREAEECVARGGGAAPPSPVDSEESEEDEEQAPPYAAPPPRAARPAARSGASAPRPAPPAPTPRLEVAAWDAGARDFTVGAAPTPSATAALPPLLAALPPGERPLLAPDARGARVPRATRQACLDRLLSRALAAAAASEGQDALMAPQRAQHRAALAAQARVDEEALYARAASKLVYSNLAAQALRAQAAPPPAEVVAAAPARSAEEVRVMLAQCAAVRGDAAVAVWAAIVAARAHSRSLCWAPPYYARRIGELPRTRPQAVDDAAEDAEEDDVALMEAQTQPAERDPTPSPPPLPPLQMPEPPAAADVNADVDALMHALLHEPLPRPPREAPAPSALDARIAALCAAAAMPGPGVDAGKEGRAAAAVRSAVATACRAFLDPLFKTGGLTREQYRHCARAATDKVCARHAGAPNAAFLERETPKLHALLTEYVKLARRHKERGSKGGAAAEAPPSQDDQAYSP